MRINFNRTTSELLFWNKPQPNVPGWLLLLRKQFLADYDIFMSGTNVYEFENSEQYAQLFCEWMCSIGYNVKFWSINFKVDDRKPTFAYGIEIDEACPKFIELKMKSI